MKIVARGCKYVRGKEGEQFFRRRIEAIRRGRIVKHDEATDGLTTSQQIAHEQFGLGLEAASMKLAGLSEYC